MNQFVVEKALDSLFLAEACGATDLLLVRHAATAGLDLSGPGLGLQGRLQAGRLAEELAGAGVKAVYSADSDAAAETGDILVTRLGIELEVVPELAPVQVDPGGLVLAWEHAGLPATVETTAQLLNFSARWDSIPGAENSRVFRRRIIQAIEAIAARHQGQTVAIVCHTCAINAYLSMVLDIPRDFFFQPVPASVSCVRIKGDMYSVRYLNSDRPLAEGSRARDRAFTAR